mmetsp:Transcript_40093/g.118857  ORF Transcript_40093/g.118857 Transcript_40093/m.118857 type:complete len:393 (-) Transcript_40093:503-1681(-)
MLAVGGGAAQPQVLLVQLARGLRPEGIRSFWPAAELQHSVDQALSLHLRESRGVCLLVRGSVLPQEAGLPRVVCQQQHLFEAGRPLQRGDQLPHARGYGPVLRRAALDEQRARTRPVLGPAEHEVGREDGRLKPLLVEALDHNLVHDGETLAPEPAALQRDPTGGPSHADGDAAPDGGVVVPVELLNVDHAHRGIKTRTKGRRPLVGVQPAPERLEAGELRDLASLRLRLPSHEQLELLLALSGLAPRSESPAEEGAFAHAAEAALGEGRPIAAKVHHVQVAVGGDNDVVRLDVPEDEPVAPPQAKHLHQCRPVPASVRRAGDERPPQHPGGDHHRASEWVALAEVAGRHVRQGVGHPVAEHLPRDLSLSEDSPLRAPAHQLTQRACRGDGL